MSFSDITERYLADAALHRKERGHTMRNTRMLAFVWRPPATFLFWAVEALPNHFFSLKISTMHLKQVEGE
jgi:hypothetical protein